MSNTTLNAALKDCPFCGSRASAGNNFNREFWIECDEGHDMGHMFKSEAEAIAAWNTRANTQESSAAQGAMGGEATCRNAIAQVCEGWTLPPDARKILETALWAQPSDAAAQWKPADDAVLLCVACSEAIAAQPIDLTDERVEQILRQAWHAMPNTDSLCSDAWWKWYATSVSRLLANTNAQHSPAQGKPDPIAEQAKQSLYTSALAAKKG